VAISLEMVFVISSFTGMYAAMKKPVPADRGTGTMFSRKETFHGHRDTKSSGMDSKAFPADTAEKAGRLPSAC